jgi:hypothetical protein
MVKAKNKPTNDIYARLRAAFGDNIPPIKDAKFPLRLYPKACDLVGADALAPDNCILVHTVKREYESKAAIFWKTQAYIDLVDTDGVVRVHRFTIRKTALTYIAAFDRGQPFEEGRPIILDAPMPGRTLKAMRKQHRNYYKSDVGKATRKLSDARSQLRQSEKGLARAGGT